jgi:dihydroorotate dehydrogenase (fumarate)
MADLSTTYMGLLLKNPIIIGSCSLTDSVDKIAKLESNGAAAVVLKSIFEEEILLDAKKQLSSAESNGVMYTDHSESFDYIDIHVKQDRLHAYINLIQNTKKKVLIPVIASINCVSNAEWIDFAKRIESAGADALELNIFIQPTDTSNSDHEEVTQEIVFKVRKKVSIPVSVKLSEYYKKPAKYFYDLSKSGIDGMVLFNKFYGSDFDIDTLEVKQGVALSTPGDYSETLRWISVLSNDVECDLVASSGIHDAEAVIKNLLAGAKAVQMVSAIYENGPSHINKVLQDIEAWMSHKGFNYLNQFRGKLSDSISNNPADKERIQFIRNYGDIS